MKTKRERKLEPFTCKKCGKTELLPYSKVRIYCTECAELFRKAQQTEWNKRVYDEKKRQQVSAEAVKPQETADEAFDARINEQVNKQCKYCLYWNTLNNAIETSHCSYYLRHGVGHRVDHGNGPGDCRCFKPKRKITKEERVQYSKKALVQSEADTAARKGSVE